MARRAARHAAIQEWFSNFAASSQQDAFGLPDEWDYDYPFELVKTGFWLWAASKFQRLPTQQEVKAYDPRWISDMQLAYTMYSFYRNDSPLFSILANWQAAQAQRKAGLNGQEHHPGA